MKNISIFLLLFICFSCTEPYPESITTEFTITNNSGVNVSLVLYQVPNDTIEISTDGVYSNKFHGRGIAIPFSCDSLGVIFNSKKKKVFKWLDSSTRNPLLLESYTKTEINKYHYIFEYVFIEQDYLNVTN